MVGNGVFLGGVGAVVPKYSPSVRETSFGCYSIMGIQIYKVVV